MKITTPILLLSASTTSAFTTRISPPALTKKLLALYAEKPIGIFFGTSTGNTEEAAHLIAAEFGDDAAGPFEIDSVQGSVAKEFEKYDALVVSRLVL